MILSGAQILIEELIHNGAETVFGYPGGSVLNIYDELYKSSDRIHHVITAHEQGACHAADGYARVTGKAGVVIATSGPGATNLVTGIANAYLDSIPLVAITGNVPCNMLGHDSFQEVDIVGITLPIVKHSYIVKDVNLLAETVSEAFKIAKEGRPGPVLIDIPKDVQINSCEYEIKNYKFRSVEDAIPSPQYDIESAVKIIKSSKKPYIYCGGGVVLSGAGSEIMELADKIQSPIGVSMMGMTAVPNEFPLNLGMTGMHGSYSSSRANAECDLIIAVGVRFSDRATGDKNKYVENRKIIHIDIDRAEFNKNISANVTIDGNIKDILAEILNEVEPQKHDEWLAEVEKFKEIQNCKPRDLAEFAPQNIVEMVNSHCNDNTVIATDVGQHQLWAVQYYKYKTPRTLLTSGGLGTMGFGMGAAIGGCFGCDKKHTVLFTGDGSFGMNLNELATAVSQKLPLIVIIMNNGVLGMVRQWQKVFYGERYSETTLNRQTNFSMLADSFGATGLVATSLDELNSCLDKAFNLNTPVVIDCHIDQDKKVLPMIPPGGSIADIITE